MVLICRSGNALYSTVVIWKMRRFEKWEGLRLSMGLQR
jgi:hypothetical protein